MMFNSSDSCQPADDANKSDLDKNSWAIAVCMAILAAVLNNLGVNFQKLAWTKKQLGGTSKSKYRIIWLIGMLGVIGASFLDFAALAFGPQSVIAPLGSITMVVNSCVAPYMHGEKLQRTVIISTLIVIAGCAMAVANASHHNNICSLQALFALYRSFRFLGICIFSLFSTSLVFWYIRKAERVEKKFGRQSEEYKKVFTLHRVTYAMLAGLFGGLSVLFARTIGLELQASARGDKFFLAAGETYAVLLGLVATIVLQIYFLNLGLARFESMYNVPVFTGTFIVSVALGGGIFYDEFSGFTVVQMVLFPLGIGLCILGVYFLSMGNGTEREIIRVDAEVEPEEKKEANEETPERISDNPLYGKTDTTVRNSSVPAFYVSPVTSPTHKTMEKTSLRIRSGGFTPFMFAEPVILEKEIVQSNSPKNETPTNLVKLRIKSGGWAPGGGMVDPTADLHYHHQKVQAPGLAKSTIEELQREYSEGVLAIGVVDEESHGKGTVPET